MKKFYLLLSLFCARLVAFGQETTTLTYTYSSGGTNTATVTGYTGDAPTDLDIPSTVENGGTTYSVTSIGANAFKDCNFNSVTLPASITSIGNDAFKLTDFNNNPITTSVHYLGTIAEWCGIDFGNDGSNPLYVGGTLTIGDNLVTELLIPEGVTAIKPYAFSASSGLTSVIIPSSVTSIGDGAFLYCYNLAAVWFTSTNEPAIGQDAFNTNGNGAEPYFYVPLGSTDNYSSLSVTGYLPLMDGAEYNNTTEYSGKTVRYTRTFPANTWVPLFVPFNSMAFEWTNKDFTIAQLSYVSSDGSSDALHWQTGTLGTIEANKPYIIKYTGATEGSYEFSHTFTGCDIESSSVLNNVEKYNNGTETNPEGFASSATRCYNLIGTYEEMNGTALTDADAYCMGGGNFHHATSSNALHAQRFYLTITDPSTGYTAPAPASMCVMVDNEVVGILEHIFEPELLIDDNYYDVLGRRIDNPQAGQLYIHQGKKIIYSDQPTIDY